MLLQVFWFLFSLLCNKSLAIFPLQSPRVKKSSNQICSALVHTTEPPSAFSYRFIRGFQWKLSIVNYNLFAFSKMFSFKRNHSSQILSTPFFSLCTILSHHFVRFSLSFKFSQFIQISPTIPLNSLH